MKRPKDMTQAELDALPECLPNGMRFTEELDPVTGITQERIIDEPGVIEALQHDDIIGFYGSDGQRYRPVLTPAGWQKAPHYL